MHTREWAVPLIIFISTIGIMVSCAAAYRTLTTQPIEFRSN